MIMVYLMSKIIIEKNGQSISMTKILGYFTGEIGRLYIASTTIAVIASMVITLPLCVKALRILYMEMIAQKMTGWIPYYIDPKIYGRMIALGVVTYAAVAVFEYGKIRKVPLDEALKNVE